MAKSLRQFQPADRLRPAPPNSIPSPSNSNWKSLLVRLADDLDAPGIYLGAGISEPVDDLSRRELVGLALAAAERFRALGISRGDRVVTLLPTGRAILQSMLGAWAAGAAFCVMAPSASTGRSALSSDRLAAMLRIAAPKLIVATASEYETLQPIAAAIGATVLVDTALPPPAGDITSIPQNAPDEAAFVQFTSGSTGVPKGIVVEHGQLVELLDACIARSRFRRGETLISWLPLHHDFGLSAGLLMPIQAGNRSILIPTEAFIRNPAIWLLAAEKWGAAFSPAAPFAMQLLTRPIFARKLANVNLAGLNTIWLGGEPVSAALVHAFEAVYAKLGLRPGVVTAGYGMAEATCTISVRAPESERRTAWVDRRKFHAEGRVEIVPAAAEGSMALLSNGSPLDCFDVRIVNDGGRRLPEGVQGRIEVRGGPVSRRYLGASASLAPGGWLDTGDLGFLLDQELYITGRTKDVIIRGGVNVNAHEIEETVLRNLADLTQRAVAFSLPHERDMRDEIVVGVEVPAWPAPARLEADIRNVLLRDLALQVDHVVAMPRGAIPRTTSGKVQRGLARERYRAGRLAERV